MKKRKKRGVRRRGPRSVRGVRDVEGDRARILALTEQLERAIGRPTRVFHEQRSELVHIDVHVIPPRPAHPFITLFTTGMSQRPLPGAPTCGCPRRAELMMTLPPSWDLPAPECCDGEDPAREACREPGRTRADPMWPAELLRGLARYPHRAGTWLGWGHTVPNGNPPRPFASDTRFCCVALFPSVLAPASVRTLEGPDGEPVELHALHPLYPAEMELKLRLGAHALVRRFDALGVTELVQDRPDVAAAGRLLRDRSA